MVFLPFLALALAGWAWAVASPAAGASPSKLQKRQPLTALPPMTAEPAADAPAPKTNGTSTKKARKLIYKAPNQQGIAQGKTRWFCVACMKGFIADGTEPPAACPEGHPMEDLHTEEVAS